MEKLQPFLDKLTPVLQQFWQAIIQGNFGQPDVAATIVVICVLLSAWLAFRFGRQAAYRDRFYSQKVEALNRISKLFYEAELGVEDLYQYTGENSFEKNLRNSASRLKKVNELFRKDLLGWDLTLPGNMLTKIQDMADEIGKIGDEMFVLEITEKMAEKKKKKLLDKFHTRLGKSYEDFLKFARSDIGVGNINNKWRKALKLD